MAKKRARYKPTKMVSPVCSFSWTNLGKPKTGGEFDGKFGQYQVTIILDTEKKEHADFIAKLEQAVLDAKKEVAKAEGVTASKLFFRDLSLKDMNDSTGESSGLKTLSISVDAAKEYDDGNIVNAKVNVISPDRKIMSVANQSTVTAGSEGIVGFDANPYYVSGVGGLSLKLRAVALKSVVNRGEASLADYFGSDFVGLEREEEEDIDVDSFGSVEDIDSGDDEHDF